MSVTSLQGYALREATAADAEAIVRVLHAAFAEHLGRLDPPSGVHAETPETFAARMPRGVTVVATVAGDDAKIVGCALAEWRDGYAYIGRVGTLPGHRGAGIAGAVLAALEERARARGYTRVRLATRLQLTALRRWYEARGYRAASYGTHAGKAWPTWIDFEKDLAAPPSRAKDEGFDVAALDHVQLAIPRGAEDEARAFWVGVLGFVEIPKAEGTAKGSGAWFQAGPAQVHVGAEEDFRPARKAHPALRVRGLDALRARLQAAGRPIQPQPPMAGCERFHSSDPFGNRVEFIAETT